MASPAGLTGKKANLSPLMKAKKACASGTQPNVCPFGCSDAHLDDHGYCHHLVGFTIDKKTMEPMFRKGEKRCSDGSKKEPVKKTDRLARITSSYRVYRDVEPDEIDLARIAEADTPPAGAKELTDDELEEMTKPE